MDKPIKEEAMEIITSWMERGIQQGLIQGVQQGLEQGVQQGLKQGVQQGLKQGVEQCSLAEVRKSIFLILQTKFSSVPDVLVEKLDPLTDLGVLENLLSQAVNCAKIDDFCNLLELELTKPTE